MNIAPFVALPIGVFLSWQIYNLMKDRAENRLAEKEEIHAAIYRELGKELKEVHRHARAWDRVKRHRAIQDQPIEIRRWERGYGDAKGVRDYRIYAELILCPDPDEPRPVTDGYGFDPGSYEDHFRGDR